MPKQVYRSEFSGAIFKIEEEALKHEEQEALEIIEREFPTHHVDDDLEKKHCVDTGELVLLHHTEWDGYRDKVILGNKAKE